MCEYCHIKDHITGCPNMPSEISYLSCKLCEEEILIDDQFIINAEGEIVCQHCLENMILTEVLQQLGYEYLKSIKQ